MSGNRHHHDDDKCERKSRREDHCKERKHHRKHSRHEQECPPKHHKSHKHNRDGDRDDRQTHMHSQQCQREPDQRHRQCHKQQEEYRHNWHESASRQSHKLGAEHAELKCLNRSSVKYNIDGTTTEIKDDRQSEFGNVPSALLTLDTEKEAEFPDYDFLWDEYKHILDKVFFGTGAQICKGTEEYTDFWAFLNKYVSYKKQKARKEKTTTGAPSKNTDTLNLSETDGTKPQINVTFKLTKDGEQSLKRYCERHGNTNDPNSLNAHRLAQFRQIILYYLDFMQKQKLAKIAKMQDDQRQLPIYQFKERIIDMVRQHKVVVVAGDTGCGKSTQMPQYLLEAGFKQMACTQPRRIACISLAKRVSYETNNEYGSEVGFQVRFEKSKTSATRILFLTEGLLLRQISGDQMLSMYDVVVMDEVHERHIHTDFLLGIMKCLLQQRDAVKLVLMSATINVELFSAYFDNAPVVKIPGRQYPITLNHCPLSIEEQGGKTSKIDPAPYLRILQAIDHKYPATERGDVLVFLSGMTEIMTVAEVTKEYAEKTKRWIILMLHSALPLAEQDKVFDLPPSGVRKCILSTNIAETSVTVDGVRFVVDSGKVKEMSFDSNYNMQRLQEFWISQASAEQRKGRAGRTGPGVCYRMYSESDYAALQEYSTPEIHRVPLDSLILQMIAMGLPDARKFPYIEPPAQSTVEHSIAFLKDQKAITEDEKLTAVGHMLAQLPVDIVIGRMLIMASIFDMLDPVLTIASSLSIRTPFNSQAQRNFDVADRRKELESDHGDLITLLNAYNEWIRMKADGQQGRSLKWCKRRGLEQQRLYEMSKLKQQFQELLQEHSLVGESGGGERREFTPAERRQRLIQRRQLRELRKQQRGFTRKRKYLKLEDESQEFLSVMDEDDDDDDDDGGTDGDVDSNIKDLEFRLTHDLEKIEKGFQSGGFTLRELHLLKSILCSGLFPQVAIADEHNSYKPDSEVAFHTRRKMFVLLHPSSVFAQKPSLLEQPEDESLSEELSAKLRSHHHTVLSSKHQLLTYVSLLETNKPYLVGLMRVPALQTLLLFSSTIDTNADCTLIVCDGWLELYIPEADVAESIVSSVVHLRATWQKLIKMKLENLAARGSEDTKRGGVAKKARKLSRQLSEKLAEFLDCKVLYSLRRMMAVESETLYVGPVHMEGEDGEGGEGTSLFNHCSSAPEHPIKGGSQVNDYLTYNCLRDSIDTWGDYQLCMQKHWTCPRCGCSLIVTIAERLQHEERCETAMTGSSCDTRETVDQEVSGTRKSFCCDVCGQEFRFTTKEMLKHRKTCTKSD